MTPRPVHRHYPFPALDFRDFWDICSHFQNVHPERDTVVYTISTTKGILVKEETDVSLILHELNSNELPITIYEARLLKSDDLEEVDENCPVLHFDHVPAKHKTGLSFTSRELGKLALFHFETLLYEQYSLHDVRDNDISIVFGRPCEILAAVVDMRGFSVFCEKPNIESPYTSALMSSFYKIVQESFVRYPPELMKYLGDGVLSVWETSYEDREIAIRVCLEGLMDLNSRWQIVRRSPQFSHGTPSDIGIGVSFGLASILTVDNDYIGRPINLASRLCSVCNGWEILVDKAIPSMPETLDREDHHVAMKSFGRANVWRLVSS